LDHCTLPTGLQKLKNIGSNPSKRCILQVLGIYSEAVNWMTYVINLVIDG
jgi:hypothetical protein